MSPQPDIWRLTGCHTPDSVVPSNKQCSWSDMHRTALAWHSIKSNIQVVRTCISMPPWVCSILPCRLLYAGQCHRWTFTSPICSVGNVPSNFSGHCAEKNFHAQFLWILVKIWALNLFSIFRDIKKANNCICLCSSRMKRQFFINRLCLISTFKLILMLVYIILSSVFDFLCAANFNFVRGGLAKFAHARMRAA